ncbi:MAG TPA: hypothetical protein VE999_15255 [Gemmataceae bacterium]|nr:hypothetical protein [Gemmataceae bacterium]
MNAKQLQDDFPEIQGAIYGVALSLESFLINGIPYGVFQREFLPGFLEKTAGNLLRVLASLEEQAQHTQTTNQAQVTKVLAGLRSSCQQLIDLVSGLIPFRTLSPEQLHSMVSQIPLLRDACVHQIQQLETYFRTPKPFYPSRPAHSTAAVNGFLANLEHLFMQERSAAESA